MDVHLFGRTGWPLDGDTPVGIPHVGFHITDTAVTSEALTAAGTPKPAEPFTNRPFAA